MGRGGGMTASMSSRLAPHIDVRWRVVARFQTLCYLASGPSFELFLQFLEIHFVPDKANGYIQLNTGIQNE